MIKNTATFLQNKIDELHFIEGALNNLEMVKVAQESQKEDGWSNFTSNVIRDLKDRAQLLKNHIRSLEGELLRQKQEANDQISMSMGYL